MTAKYGALVAGTLCLDVIPQIVCTDPQMFRKTFAPGRTTLAGEIDFSPGGAVPNVGLALDMLGIRTRLVGKTGADVFGEVLRNVIAARLAASAVDIRVDDRSRTSYSIIINPPGRDRFFMHFPGANDDFTADDIDSARLERVRLMHFGYPPMMRSMFENDGAELARLFHTAKEHGVITSLDMTMPDPNTDAGRAPWLAILKKVLPHVHIFVPSIEELLYMMRPDTFTVLRRQAREGDILPLITPALLTEIAGDCLGMGVKIMGVKLGSRGFYLRTGDTTALPRTGLDYRAWNGIELWAPCFEVDVCGTIGAGDATIAGFLAAFLRGLSPQDAVRAAVAVGACSVEARDSISGIRSWEKTMERIAGGWRRHAMMIDVPGWRFDSVYHQWSRH